MAASRKRKIAYSITSLLCCFGFTLVFWDWLYPINVFVVFLHEWSHGLAALLTGGKIAEIYLDPRVAGWCRHTSQWQITVGVAGYIGSAGFGAALMFLGAIVQNDRFIVGFLGAFMTYIAVVYVGTSFGMAFCLGFAAFLFFTAAKLSDGLNDFILRFLGMSSCLYAVVRIKSHLFAHWYGWKHQLTGNAKLDQIWSKSDALRLSEITGLPEIAWWSAFLLIGIVCFYYALYYSVKYEAGFEDNPKDIL